MLEVNGVIVCQCNIISVRELEEAVLSLLEADAWRLIVPVQVYHEMGKRGRCCGCFPNVVDVIVRTTEAFHMRLQTPQPDVIDLIGRLKSHHDTFEQTRREARDRLSKVA
jgi:hypothetical protein